MKISIKLSDGSLLQEDTNLPKVIIGRSQKCDIVVGDAALSRHHCLLENENGNLFITDLGSANGVFISGERLPVEQRTSFNTFFPVQLGNLELQVSFQDQGNSVNRTTTFSKRPADRPQDTMSTTKLLQNLSGPAERTFQGSKKKFIETSQIWLQLSILLFIGISGTLIYYTLIDPAEKLPTGPQVQLPPHVQQTPAAFLTQARYLELYAQKECPPSEICGDLGITPKSSEGVVNSSEEVFIFLQEEKLKETKIPKIKTDKEQRILAALTRVFEAKIFKDTFFNKEIAQIHVVLLGPGKKIQTVIRFHAKDLNSTSVTIYNGLYLAKSFGNFALLLERSSPLMQIKDF